MHFAEMLRLQYGGLVPHIISRGPSDFLFLSLFFSSSPRLVFTRGGEHKRIRARPSSRVTSGATSTRWNTKLSPGLAAAQRETSNARTRLNRLAGTAAARRETLISDIWPAAFRAVPPPPLKGEPSQIGAGDAPAKRAATRSSSHAGFVHDSQPARPVEVKLADLKISLALFQPLQLDPSTLSSSNPTLGLIHSLRFVIFGIYVRNARLFPSYATLHGYSPLRPLCHFPSDLFLLSLPNLGIET